jgi:hypothetical protein
VLLRANPQADVGKKQGGNTLRPTIFDTKLLDEAI